MMAKDFKIKLALVTSSLRLAGAEKQTVYFARALRAARIEVICFFLGQDGHYERELRQMRIPVRQIYEPNRPWSILIRLLSAFWQFRPDITFVPQFGDLIHGGLPGRLCQSLVVGGVRSDGLQELKVHKHRSPLMLRLAHGILANSVTGRENLIKNGVNVEKVQLLPNVIDLDEFCEQSTAPVSIQIPQDRVVAAAVGSLQPGKRFDRFIDALSLARRQAPALFGVIAGSDRGCKAELQQRATQAGLTPAHIAFIGECQNIPALLTQSAFLVVCSEFEGFPNTILEAMAAEIPVLTTRAGDAPLVVRHCETGYVLDSGDVQEMAEYMVELALLPETRMRTGAEGGKRLRAEYSFESLQGKLLKSFRDFATQQGRFSLAKKLQDYHTASATSSEFELVEPRPVSA
jgi:glycosyltransferase involved in cell wall biosynthesis